MTPVSGTYDSIEYCTRGDYTVFMTFLVTAQMGMYVVQGSATLVLVHAQLDVVYNHARKWHCNSQLGKPAECMLIR